MPRCFRPGWCSCARAHPTDAGCKGHASSLQPHDSAALFPSIRQVFSWLLQTFGDRERSLQPMSRWDLVSYHRRSLRQRGLEADGFGEIQNGPKWG